MCDDPHHPKRDRTNKKRPDPFCPQLGLGQSGVPILALNSLKTDTERSEQRGLTNLFIGMFGTFRNTTAHGPRVSWPVSEQDALDLLTLVSFLHRRLDDAKSAIP